MAMNEDPGSITEPQHKYIVGLVEKKDLSSLAANEIAFLESDPANYMRMSKKQADTAIKKLLSLNDKPIKPVTPATVNVSDSFKYRYAQMMLEANSSSSNSSKAGVTLSLGEQQIRNEAVVETAKTADLPTENVPDAGYYFVVDPTSNPPGKESFFRVSKPDENSRWHGYTFLAIQASDDFYPIKDKARRDAIYAAILVDPINAMNEYGIRLGRCGVCNRTLTDRDSRLRGIGPICAARLDSTPSQEDLDLLTQLGMIDPES